MEPIVIATLLRHEAMQHSGARTIRTRVLSVTKCKLLQVTFHDGSYYEIIFNGSVDLLAKLLVENFPDATHYHTRLSRNIL